MSQQIIDLEIVLPAGRAISTCSRKHHGDEDCGNGGARFRFQCRIHRSTRAGSSRNHSLVAGKPAIQASANGISNRTSAVQEG